MINKYYKRFLDFVLVAFVCIVVSPIILSIFIVLAMANNGKVFFHQDRCGINGRVFRLIKFRTMTDSRNEEGRLLPDSERLTKVGRFLRSLSLDELPQLFNVIKGDMSLVGPRPLLVKYLPRYNEFQSRRHEVRPGITGWAQVNGRNALSWEKKFEYDVWYVDNISFRLDIKILFMTLIKVLKRENIFHGEGITMEEFKGSAEQDKR